MRSKYKKCIVLDSGEISEGGRFAGQPEVIVLYDDKSHIPTFYGLKKMAMDDILNLFGGDVVDNNLENK